MNDSIARTLYTSLACKLGCAGIFAILAGCSTLFAPPVAPGEPESQVIASLGQPTDTYAVGNDRLLEYNGGAFGQYTYMARIGPDSRLISYEQVWTLENFNKIKVNEATKADVLRLIGHPTEVTRYARIPYDAWNYGFKESGVWNSMMTVYFDDQGIVRKLENGPDPRFEKSRFGRF